MAKEATQSVEEMHLLTTDENLGNITHDSQFLYYEEDCVMKV